MERNRNHRRSFQSEENQAGELVELGTREGVATLNAGDPLAGHIGGIDDINITIAKIFKKTTNKERRR